MILDHHVKMNLVNARRLQAVPNRSACFFLALLWF